jgi:peptidyl-prolyl cis-trans isomerase C
MRRLAFVTFFVVACDNVPDRGERCLELPPAKSPVVARVGDASVSMEQVERRLREQGSGGQKLGDPERLKRFVEDQVRFELLVQAARERGLDRDPAVVEAARNVMVRKLLQQDLGAEAFAGRADDEAIRAYYQNHIDDYVQPEKRRLAHIQLAPSTDGKAAAQGLIDKLKSAPADRKMFRWLATQHSVDKDSRAKGGELGTFMSQEELARELGSSFAEAAFALSEGEISTAPVSSVRGWHVVSLLAAREAQARSLEAVKDEIKDRLLQSERSQMFDKYLSDIRQRYRVAIYEDQLPALVARMTGESAGTP